MTTKNFVFRLGWVCFKHAISLIDPDLASLSADFHQAGRSITTELKPMPERELVRLRVLTT